MHAPCHLALKHSSGVGKCVVHAAGIISSDISIKVCKAILHFILIQKIEILHAILVDCDATNQF